MQSKINNIHMSFFITSFNEINTFFFLVWFQFELLRIKADIQRVTRLINIARPIELPPLKSDDTKSDRSQAKKKFELPLFGKKKTFGFDRLKQQAVNAKPSKPSETQMNDGETIEEFDDDENDTKSSKQMAEGVSETATTESPIDEALKVATGCDDEIKESTSAVAKGKSVIKEQEIIHEKKMPTAKINDTTHHKSTPSQPPATATDVENEKNNPEPPVVNTKSRNKNRNRNKARQQIDIDDTEEDTSPQKYSGWMPPSNQSGDGITDLNSKYGY